MSDVTSFPAEEPRCLGRGHSRTVQVVLRHAVFGLVIRAGKIADAPPIARCCIGKDERRVAAYYRSRGAVFLPVPRRGEAL